ncbi:bacteriocin secretion accessory protein [Lapidilactobacillus salsurivasis]
MDKQNTRLFESSEFYNRRYKNFATMIVLPVTLIIFLSVVFSLVAKREVSLKTSGEIQPNRVIADIQSTTSNNIIQNNMFENMQVTKGQTLVKYSGINNETQLKYLLKQQSDLKEQAKQLRMLKEGIETNQSVFGSDDKFGYSQQLTDYLNQRHTLEVKSAKDNSDVNAQNAMINDTKSAIDKASRETAEKISEYEEVKAAIRDNRKSISDSNSLGSMFATYHDTIEKSGNTSDSKNKIITEIQTSIAQLQESINAYNTQRAGSGALMTADSSLELQLKSLQSQELLRVAKEMTEISIKLDEIASNITIQDDAAKRNTIISPRSGILHVSDEMKAKREIPTGTTLAQIYPTIKAGRPIRIVAYISS